MILVGKVTKDLEIRETTNGRSFAIATLEVEKENPETGASKSELNVSLWGVTAENTAKYAGEGSIISIRGRAANRLLDFPGEQTLRTIGIVGEQVSFIQTKAPGAIRTNTHAKESENNLPFSLNQAILIGRTTRDMELKKTKDGRSYGIVTLAVTRKFKNLETNAYDSDFIDVSLWGANAKAFAKNAGGGSAVTIRGHIVNRILDFPGETTINSIGIVGDKVSFLSIKPPQIQQQISDHEVESKDEYIPLIEENLEQYPDVTNKKNQNNKEVSLGD